MKELLGIAKLKGYSDKLKAVHFINEATGMDDFTMMPADYFENYKKQVMGDFLKPHNEDDPRSSNRFDDGISI